MVTQLSSCMLVLQAALRRLELAGVRLRTCVGCGEGGGLTPAQVGLGRPTTWPSLGASPLNFL